MSFDNLPQTQKHSGNLWIVGTLPEQLIGGSGASSSVICHACSRRPSARSIFYFGRNQALRKSYFCPADALGLNQAKLTGSMILMLLVLCGVG